MQVCPGTGRYPQHLTGTTCTCELPYLMGKDLDHVPSIDNQYRTGLTGRLRKVHAKIL